MLTAVVVFAAFGGALFLGAVQRRHFRLRSISRGLLVTCIMLIGMTAGGELFFHFVYAEPDGLPTLAAQNWLGRYWHTNADGFRDRNWTPADLAGKSTILVIGDSFAAGWGIADPADRFSDVLASRLGDSFAVLNLGQPGASTLEETELLKTATVQAPDFVVLQYYLNDIETAALSIGLDPGLDPGRDMPDWAHQSYLGNFIYWRLNAVLSPSTRGEQTYWSWLYSMYDNATVWDIHQRQLEAFVDEVESRGAQPVFVLFPNMLDPVGSIPYVDRVAQLLAARGYQQQTIRLFDAAAAMPLNERIVSARDAHASVAFHHLVGEMLYEKIQTLMAER